MRALRNLLDPIFGWSFGDHRIAEWFGRDVRLFHPLAPSSKPELKSDNLLVV